MVLLELEQWERGALQELYHSTWPLPQSEQLGEGDRVIEYPNLSSNFLSPYRWLLLAKSTDNKMASGSEFCSLWMSAYWGIEQDREQQRIDSERTQRIDNTDSTQPPHLRLLIKFHTHLYMKTTARHLHSTVHWNHIIQDILCNRRADKVELVQSFWRE